MRVKVIEDKHRILLGPWSYPGLRVLKNAILHRGDRQAIKQQRIFINGRASKHSYYHWVLVDTLNPIMVGRRTKKW